MFQTIKFLKKSFLTPKEHYLTCIDIIQLAPEVLFFLRRYFCNHSELVKQCIKIEGTFKKQLEPDPFSDFLGWILIRMKGIGSTGGVFTA